MKKNMGNVDRIVRTVVAIVIGVLLVTGRVHGTLAIILGVVGVAFLVTSAFGYCPVYVPLKLSTCKSAAPANK